MKLQNSDILFEDNHLIIVNKPCGILVQGDKTGDTPLLDIIKEYIKVKYSKQGDVFLGLVNRIDRPTSGIVIFAKTSKALSRMNEKLKKPEIKKLYWLIISNSKHGLLNYRKIEILDKYSKIEVDLITGRHHQIRCSFSEIGFPILGDLKYGSKRSNKDGGIYLHSREIYFTHPVTKEEINIKAEPPKSGLWSASPSDL